MRLGLLTIHDVPNYGANLQAYCSVRTLRMLGHEVYVYDYNDPRRESVYTHVDAAQRKMHREFAEEHLPLTSKCCSEQELRMVTERLGIDGIVVGSDAVFRIHPEGGPKQYGAYPSEFWLHWCSGLPLKKVALAPSCMGTPFYRLSRRQRRNVRNDVARFDRLSARDRWTGLFLLMVGQRMARWVPDPTCMMGVVCQPPEEYCPAWVRRQRYCMLTFSGHDIDVRWHEAFVRNANDRGLQVYAVPHPDRKGTSKYPCNAEVLEALHPFAWLHILINACGYIGERFHPVVISTYLGKPVIATDYYSSSRLRGQLLKWRSKTFDFCSRAGMRRVWYPRDAFYRKVRPEIAVDWLVNNRVKHAEAFITRCRDRFCGYLREALCAYPLGDETMHGKQTIGGRL
jgi:hypothetical protein